jgi:hypothetical protein
MVFDNEGYTFQLFQLLTTCIICLKIGQIDNKSRKAGNDTECNQREEESIVLKIEYDARSKEVNNNTRSKKIKKRTRRWKNELKKNGEAFSGDFELHCRPFL